MRTTQRWRDNFTPREIDLTYRRLVDGELTNEQILGFYQTLLDTGWAWRFPRETQREIAQLILGGILAYEDQGKIPRSAL